MTIRKRDIPISDSLLRRMSARISAMLARIEDAVRNVTKETIAEQRFAYAAAHPGRRGVQEAFKLGR